MHNPVQSIKWEGLTFMWIFLSTLSYIFFLLLNIIIYAKYYFTSRLTVGGFAQVLYTLQNSMSGSENTVAEVIGDFFARQWPLLLIGTLAYIALLLVYIYNKQGILKTKFDPAKFTQTLKGGIIVLLCLMISVDTFQGIALYEMLGIGEYQASLGKESDLYEKYYVDANTTEIKFPEKKRNLIYILCESMEQSYTDTKEGGGFKKSLIPELTKLAKENTDFSAKDDKNLNGGLTPGNTVWTIAGIAAQSMAIPLNIGNGEFNRNFEDSSQFMPTVQGLGDILEDEGYHNYFMCGSDAAFAGRKNYYEQHGNYQIFDYNTAKKDGIIDDDYYVFWGYEDKKLFQYAKKELTDIAKNDQPFNFTMLTVDTHFQDGYKCPDCPDEFDSQYENVIKCSDHKVAEFVKWCQKQDFYKDTTIVIAGDHQSMDGFVAEAVPDDFTRKTFFTVINGPEYKLNRTREYSTMDIFPTILESLGATIQGSRLGLGTSLYSETPTLIELLGYDELNRQMSYTSKFYNEVIMSGDESKMPKKEGEEEQQPQEEQQVVQAPTAQEYQANRDNFSDSNYVWTPPVYNEPVYNEPSYTPPAQDTGTDNPGDSGTTTPPSTGGDSGTTTPPSTGEDSGSTTPPSTGGDSGTTTPPSSGGDSGSTTPPSTGGDSGTTTPPSTGGDSGGTTPPSTGGDSGTTQSAPTE